ncbi:MAG: hypothetical protein R3D89_04455 [Sphingomonadaceae bacterium]
MTTVYINEFHYDNSGADVGEFFEIAGPAGTDLTGWSLVLYNGGNGATYGTIALSGTIPDQSNGLGTLQFATPLQNGSPDGFALYDGASVIQFLSYEGSFTAIDSVANGLTSTDIGVLEGGEPAGQSLSLSGSGRVYEDFTWSAPAAESPGAVNVSQTFEALLPRPRSSSTNFTTTTPAQMSASLSKLPAPPEPT